MAETKAEKRIRAAKNAKVLQEWAGNNGIQFIKIQDWHFRLTNEDSCIDIFPQKKHFHNVTDNDRGEYTDLMKFISSHFNTNQ